MTTTEQNSAKARFGRSKLDRAIVASVAAMTVFVLAQQMQPTAVLAAAQGAVQTQQA